MAELKENQLLLLNNLIYLEGVANAEGNADGVITVEDVLKYLLDDGGLEQSRDVGKIGTNQEWPCLMSRNEWLEILKQIEDDPGTEYK